MSAYRLRPWCCASGAAGSPDCPLAQVVRDHTGTCCLGRAGETPCCPLRTQPVLRRAEGPGVRTEGCRHCLGDPSSGAAHTSGDLE